jgi:hypothetical protein
MFGKGSIMKGKPSVNKGKKLGPRPYQTGENNQSKRKEVRDKISQKLLGKERKNSQGSKSSNYGGNKILLKGGELVCTFERFEEILEIVPTSIYNLRNHLRQRSGGLICGDWQVFYEKDYYKKGGSK